MYHFNLHTPHADPRADEPKIGVFAATPAEAIARFEGVFGPDSWTAIDLPMAYLEAVGERQVVEHLAVAVRA